MRGDAILIASSFVFRFVYVTEITYLGPMPRLHPATHCTLERPVRQPGQPGPVAQCRAHPGTASPARPGVAASPRASGGWAWFQARPPSPRIAVQVRGLYPSHSDSDGSGYSRGPRSGSVSGSLDRRWSRRWAFFNGTAAAGSIWNLDTPEFIHEFMKHMNSHMKKSYEFICYMNSYMNSYI